MTDRVDQDLDTQRVTELAFGRWRSQALYAGVDLGVFDELDRSHPLTVDVLAQLTGTRPDLLYRLLRALGALEVVIERADRTFLLSDAGYLLAKDHPSSLRNMVLLEEGPEHYALWKHLPAMIRDGSQDAFHREYGMGAFEYARKIPKYGNVFNAAMSSFSTIQSRLVVEALQEVDLSTIAILCDIAGGEGHLLCSILSENDGLQGVVFDLPEVTAAPKPDWPTRMNVSGRCRFEPGDMFIDVPAADAYSLKMILHDWNDVQCKQILSNARRRTAKGARIFIAEHVVPGPAEPHFSKLYDIHMMCWGTGRERTEEEYFSLLAESRWRGIQTHYPLSRAMAVVEGVAI
jgi:hypothetical protein